MSTLPTSLIELLNQIRGKDLEDAFHASRELGMLIERHSQNRYGDASYEMLLSSKELHELRLTDPIVRALTEELFSILENYKDRASLAIWPLGKTFSPAVIDQLLKYLEAHWEDNDVVCSEVLMTVYDQTLLRNYWGLIKKIAKEGVGESKKLAHQHLAQKSAR